jgi:hypothetical protein
LSIHRSVESHVRHSGHELLEKIALNHVYHQLHLTEDETTMLRGSGNQLLYTIRPAIERQGRLSNSTIEQKLPTESE